MERKNVIHGIDLIDEKLGHLKKGCGESVERLRGIKRSLALNLCVLEAEAENIKKQITEIDDELEANEVKERLSSTCAVLNGHMRGNIDLIWGAEEVIYPRRDSEMQVSNLGIQTDELQFVTL
jgi:uncharacterized protein YqgV (UPF0045/DUF77 family)